MYALKILELAWDECQGTPKCTPSRTVQTVQKAKHITVSSMPWEDKLECLSMLEPALYLKVPADGT